jgi:hypothetical protein
MKYRVRSSDGELEYSSFGEVEKAWNMGLIEPNDEVLEEGQTLWRKAGALPVLAAARRTGDQVWMGTWFLWVLLGVTVATVALMLLRAPSYTYKAAGVALAFADAGVMFFITQRAYQRAKPHG